MKRSIGLLCCLILLFSILSTPASAAGRWTHIIDVICINRATIALRDDGHVLYAGNPDYPASREVSGWSDVEWIEALGDSYLVGDRSDGRVYLAELNASFDTPEVYFNQQDVDDWTNVRQVEIVGDFCLGLRYDGVLYWVVYGDQAVKAASATKNWPALADVKTDGYHAIVGLTTDGTVLATDPDLLTNAGGYWGGGTTRASDWKRVNRLYYSMDLFGVRSDGVAGMNRPGWDGVSALYLGIDSMFGLRYDGTVAANFGEYFDTDERLQQIASWRNIVDLGFDSTMSYRYLPVGLKSDGTIAAVTYACGEPYGEWDFHGWSNVQKLYSGSEYTFGLRSDGSVLATGGEFETLSYLNTISRWTGIRELYPAHGVYMDHVVGLRLDGTLIAAGDNSCGQCNVNS